MAQAVPDTVRAVISRDSAQHLYYLSEQERAQAADTVRKRKDGLYRKAKQISKRGRIMGELYRFLFREPDNPFHKEDVQDDNLDRKFRRFNGRVIRKVHIMTLDVFGPKVFDTTAIPKNFLEKAGNYLHATSRPFIIRGQLSFREGDRFRSTLISNNERILRQTGILVDARIKPLPIKGTRDSVDILVITQDIFTLSGGFSPLAVDNYVVDIQERNLLGLNHTLALKYEYFGRAVPHQVNNYRAYYFVPYLSPRSFISAEAEVINSYQEHTYRTRVFRDFLFTTTRTAGSAEVRVSNYFAPYVVGDTVNKAYVKQEYFDGWIGRAFPLNISGDKVDRVRVVTSARLVTTKYADVPFVSADSNQIFRDRQLGLASIGYVERDYFRDVLINGYGRTEDVPYGLSFSATFGVEHNPDGNRSYYGARYAQSRFFKRAGYLNYSFEAGTYLNYTQPEQGAVRVEALYFTPLLPLGRINFRQFVRLRYVNGTNRFYSEFLSIASDNGIRGTSAQAFEGQRSLVLNLETVLFFNFDLLSFKAAPFFLADFGWAAKGYEKLVDRTPYTGLGLGLRLYNERLAFNSIELRLSYYPNIPDQATPFKPNFTRRSPFNLQDFTIGRPDVVRFQ